jgi:dihydrofolate synthase/folylpolyglutamate synthase
MEYKTLQIEVIRQTDKVNGCSAMKISSIEEAVSLLNEYVPKVSAYSGDGMTLDRMWPLLELVGNPHQKLKAIHIAGTSGKTSTSYYIAAMLKQSGNTVGLTISPHVDSITERLQINGQPVSDKLFCSELGMFMDLIGNDNQMPSYFELLIVFVFWFFERAKVDYVVVETGMGGLLDGTNVLQHDDKVCVITDIGFDHMHILGNNLPEIAAQKAGIIQYKNAVFMYNQSSDVMNSVDERVKVKSARLNTFTYDDLFKNSVNLNLPEFQKRNWLLSNQVVQALAVRDGFDAVLPLPESIIVPGRMEKATLEDGSLLIMDGAHNGQKMETFVASFKAQHPEQKAVVMIALKMGKEFQEVIDALNSITAELIITTFSTSQDLPAVSQDPKIIENYCLQRKIKATVIENSEEATNYLLSQKCSIKVITGSFYLLGQVRHLLSNKSVIL